MEKEDEQNINQIIKDSENNVKHLENVLQNKNIVSTSTNEYITEQISYFKLVILYHTKLKNISEKIQKDPVSTLKMMSMVLNKIEVKLNHIVNDYNEENVEYEFERSNKIFRRHQEYYKEQISIFNQLNYS
jgi:hypothetical protein